MALTLNKAMARATELLNTSSAGRACREAMYGLWLAMTYGKQWKAMAPGARGGTTLNQLRLVIDPDRRDVRVAMNEVRPQVIKANSRIMPRRLDYTVTSASPARNDRVAARVGKARMDLYTEATKAKSLLRHAVRWRTVLGSVIVRRTIRSRGPVVDVRDAYGEVSEREDGSHRYLRTFEHGWMICPPYEFVRDPSANDWSFEGEDCIGHEKPCSVDLVRRRFSGVRIETKATMGQLLEYQAFLYRATGHGANLGFQESKMPAVMLSEWWFRDSQADSRNPWPWRMLCYRDTVPIHDSAEQRALKVLEFGRNEYHGLPLHHFCYDVRPGSAWGEGIPQQVIPQQNIYNLALTSFVRTLLQHSGSQYVVIQNSIEGKLTDVLNRDQSVPIIVTPGGAAKHWPPVHRLTPPPIDATAAMFLQQGPGWMDSALNTAPIQRGQTSKRGEAGYAIQLKQEQADTPHTARTDEDEDITNALLTGTLFDIAKTDSLKELRETLSHQFGETELRAFKTQDFAKAGIGVRVTPDSLRPKTPSEYREEYQLAVSSQLLTAEAARLSMLARGGVVTDYREGLGFENQKTEAQILLDGGECEVTQGQHHGAHIFYLQTLQDMAHWPLLSEEQRGAILDHQEEHERVLLAQQLIEQDRTGGQGPTAGELPGEGPEGPPEMMMTEAMPLAQGQGQVLPFPPQGSAPVGSAQAPAPGLAGAPGAGLAAVV